MPTDYEDPRWLTAMARLMRDRAAQSGNDGQKQVLTLLAGVFDRQALLRRRKDFDYI
jgi:hypothetical protein